MRFTQVSNSRTDGDFFKVIVIFNRQALADLKPQPLEREALEAAQPPLILTSKNDEIEK